MKGFKESKAYGRVVRFIKKNGIDSAVATFTFLNDGVIGYEFMLNDTEQIDVCMIADDAFLTEMTLTELIDQKSIQYFQMIHSEIEGEILEEIAGYKTSKNRHLLKPF